jgi:exodeoxyribonuclease VIII
LEADAQTVPEPGRYENVPDHVYHRGWDALNASTLGYLKRSPLYCRWRLDNPDEGTAAKSFGTAVHCAVLEPERFSDRYRLDPQCPPERKPRGWRNTNEYKEARADLEERGFSLLTQAELDGARRITERIYSEPGQIRDILSAKTATEVSYVADDEATGLRCKVRPDIEVRDAQMVVDLKTTRNASHRAFERSIYQYGYHRSKAFYLDVMNAEGSRKWDHYLFLAVENTPPFEIALYDLDPDATDLGRRDMEELKAVYARCKESGQWLGYTTDIQTIGLPRYAYYEENEDDE